MEFEWDENKNQSNKLTHGISFEVAIEVFDDPFELTDFDQHVAGEDRWRTVGLVRPRTVLVVIHAERHKANRPVVRIISARAATPMERRLYEQSRREDR